MTAPQKFKPGHVREDGYIFHGYNGKYEKWYSPDTWHNQRILKTWHNIKNRSVRDNLPFDISRDDLARLFPADGLCPALKIKLEWSDKDGRGNSPSLDRIVPEKGYVNGNVRWLSQLANQIKTNATTAEVCAVADYLRNCT